MLDFVEDIGSKYEVRLGKDHRHFRSRMDAIIQNMFEINYSQLIQYEILEKLVTFIHGPFYSKILLFVFLLF